MMASQRSGPTDSAREAASARTNARARDGGATGPAQFFAAARAALDSRARLFKLEAKKNAISAAYVAVFAVGAAVLGVTAWLVLLGALFAGAVAAGLHWVLAVIIALALQALVIFMLVRAIRPLLKNTTFAATRGAWSSRHLRSSHGHNA